MMKTKKSKTKWSCRPRKCDKWKKVIKQPSSMPDQMTANWLREERRQNPFWSFHFLSKVVAADPDQATFCNYMSIDCGYASLIQSKIFAVQSDSESMISNGYINLWQFHRNNASTKQERVTRKEKSKKYATIYSNKIRNAQWKRT